MSSVLDYVKVALQCWSLKMTLEKSARRYVSSLLLATGVYSVSMFGAVMLDGIVPHIEKAIFFFPLIFIFTAFVLMADFMRHPEFGRKK